MKNLRTDILYASLLSFLMLGLNIVWVSSHIGFIHKPEAVLETDHYHYIEMAKRPGNSAETHLARQAPFCWRILTPYLVFLQTKTGLSLNAAYYMTTNWFLFCFLSTFYLYLRKLGFDHGYSALGVILLGMIQGAVRWYEYQYWMTDPACLFFVVLAFYLIENRSRKLLLAVSIIAVTARETYVMIFVYYFLNLLRTNGPKTALVRASLLAIAPGVVLLLIRYYIVPVSSPSVLRALKANLGLRSENLLNNQIYFCTIGSFGVFFPLLVLFPQGLFRYCKNNYDALAVIAMVYASLAIACNTDRLLAYALPVLLPLSLKNLKALNELTAISPIWFVAPILGIQTLFFAQTRLFHVKSVSIYQPTNVWVVLATCVLWVFFEAAILMRKHGREDLKA